jgi:hypothetical protein
MFFLSWLMRELEEYPAESLDARLETGSRPGNEAALKSTVIIINILK